MQIEALDGPVPSTARQILEWLYVKSQATELTARANKLRDLVDAAIEQGSYTDDKGNVFYDLDRPLTVGEKTYGAVKRELRVKRVPNEERVMALALRVGAYDQLFPLKRVMDPDELYVLYQDGVISESDIDGVYDSQESYALMAVKA